MYIFFCFVLLPEMRISISINSEQINNPRRIFAFFYFIFSCWKNVEKFLRAFFCKTHLLIFIILHRLSSSSFFSNHHHILFNLLMELLIKMKQICFKLIRLEKHERHSSIFFFSINLKSTFIRIEWAKIWFFFIRHHTQSRKERERVRSNHFLMWFLLQKW